ncbi:hypothetical protein DPMN_084236 [Dreissena polymorpha]|uniref:Ig-like domain-containing protein n=1 Tax=Dreissena polymorpha TaxID=45954 RepID=A0A9D4BID9_DREPO|nr:hypothetical protein DPMN_084236 [Dreissena polymorpha]
MFHVFTAVKFISVIPGKPMFIDFDGSFDAGSPKTFVCVSNGSRPTATISWSLDGQPMGEFDFVVIPQLNGTSNVRSTVRRTLSRDFDGSTLTCAVTNKVLEARGLPPLMSHITLRASCENIYL